jgi:RimJ/RimL family protein N-acetyltransferase
MCLVSSHGDEIHLRPVEERDLEVLGRFDTDPALSEPFEWRGYRDPQARRRRWQSDGYLGTDDSLLVVSLADGTFAGFVAWRPVAISGPQGAIQLGIVLLPEHRGRGIGSRAQQLLADYLFSTTTAHRLEASTEVDNHAEQSALERAGFTKEGLMRGRSFVRGQWRDGYMYSRLREDPAPDVVHVRPPK